MNSDETAIPNPSTRWFHPTPGRLLVLLLAVEVVLLLSERFRWFPFNENKGWTVLIATAAVGVFLLLMLLWYIISLVFRWHFQFSIRSLLVLTITVAVPFSWLAVEIKWAKEQKEAVEALRKLGGFVNYDKYYNKSTHQPALLWMGKRLGDDFFGNVVMISLKQSRITDMGLEYLKNLSQLEWLDLSYTNVTDVGLEHLKGLKQLRWLNLENSNVTDVGLEYLKGLTQLPYLYLYHTKATDAGVARLKKALPNCLIEH